MTPGIAVYLLPSSFKLQIQLGSLSAHRYGNVDIRAVSEVINGCVFYRIRDGDQLEGTTDHNWSPQPKNTTASTSQ
jgi:hypothetical protein